MRLPERHTLSGQVVRDSERLEIPALEASGCTLPVDLHGLDHRRKHPKNTKQGIMSIKDPLLVLLQILIVGQRQSLQAGQQPDEVTHNPAGLTAGQFAGIGILLLRKHRAAGGNRIVQAHEAEFAGHPEDDVLAETRKVNHQHGGGVEKIAGKIPVAHSIERIRGQRAEAQILLQLLPVDAKLVTDTGSRAQRAGVGLLRGPEEPAPVALEHLYIGQQVMGKEHRLGALQVSVGGNNDILARLSALDDRLHQCPDGIGCFFSRPLHIETEVRRHLVIAAPAGMQLRPRLPDELAQPGLDVHVDVLKLFAEGEASRLDLAGDQVQP